MGDKQEEVHYEADDLVTINQIAGILHLQREQVRQLVHKHGLIAGKVGLNFVIRYGDLDPLYERDTIPGPKPRPYKPWCGVFDE